MTQNWKSIQVNVFGVLVPLPWVLLVVLIATGFSLTRDLLNQNKWRTFDSGQEYVTGDHPDFKLDYPATWGSNVYYGYDRGTEDVWADFGDCKFFLVCEGLRIFWRPMTNPNLDKVSSWGKELINRYRGSNISELQDAQVGVGNYPAQIQTFQSNHTYQVVYILDDSGAYIFLFNAKPYNDEVKGTFNQILASFQILDPPS